MNDYVAAGVTLAVSIVGLATLAVLLSKNAQTTGVIQALGNAFGTAITDAVSPITAGAGGNLGS
jgi:uncharacterized protein involved in tellurium resistance